MTEPRPDAGRGPPLARSTLDRAAQLRTDAVWLAEAWQRARVLVVADGQALVAGDRLVLVAAGPGARRASGFPRRRPAGTPYFAVVAPLPATGPTTWPGRTASARSATSCPTSRPGC